MPGAGGCTVRRTHSRRRGLPLAATIARLEHAALVDSMVARGGFRSPTAGDICRLALYNYFAGALVLPYGRFHRLARACRHDLDRLALETGASLEQVCHRLSTLQRGGMKGVPFYFAKVDRAGNITKRHSATRFQFARLGGACAVWNVHQAFESAGQTLVQLGEMPDGARYLCLARTVSAPAARYGQPPRVYALGSAANFPMRTRWCRRTGSIEIRAGRAARLSRAASARGPIAKCARFPARSGNPHRSGRARRGAFLHHIKMRGRDVIPHAGVVETPWKHSTKQATGAERADSRKARRRFRSMRTQRVRAEHGMGHHRSRAARLWPGR